LTNEGRDIDSLRSCYLQQFLPFALLKCSTERRSWITSYSIELALRVLFVLSVVDTGHMSSSKGGPCVARQWFL
jgi:hypothetical protein